jgi:hypothetical protein
VHRSTPTTPARVTSQGGRRAGVAARTGLDFWFDAAILAGYTVAAVVGVVVLIGLAWNRLRPSLPGEGPGGRALVVRGQVVKGLPPSSRRP